jgi:hypothetical protein
MEKPSNKNEGYSIAIHATLEEPNLLQILVEKLAECNLDFGYCFKQVQPGWKAIETSSIEVMVSGGIHLSNKNELLDIPFITSFMFTCTKTAKEKFDLTWSYSLN